MKISIIIAAYDRLDFLKVSLNSAINQNYDSYEVLVVNDGSGGKTKNWLDEIEKKNDNIRIIHQENQGVASARQNGLKSAKGDYILILDSDDILRKDAAKTLALTLENNEADFVYCNNIESRGGIKRESNYKSFKTNNEFVDAVFLNARIPFKHSGALFRRIDAICLGGYDTKLNIKIDIEFLLKFLSSGKKVVLCSENLVEFAFHKASISRRRLSGIRTWWYLIDKYCDGGISIRFRYKFVRTIWELLKSIFEAVVLR